MQSIANDIVINARRVYIIVNGIEYVVRETDEGVHIDRSDTGGVLIRPNAANSITIIPGKKYVAQNC